MMASARFSAQGDFSNIGDPRANFVYDGANRALSATAYGYDALPELVRWYSAPPSYTPDYEFARTGTLPLPVAGVWGIGERDAVTGLDYMGARFYWGALGRFLSPDPENAGAVPQSPGSWNMYSYAYNNPLSYIDPSGLCSKDAGGNYHDEDDSGKLEFKGSCVQGNTATADVSQIPTFQDYRDFYDLWNSGRGPSEISYGPNDGMTKDLAASVTFHITVRQEVRSRGCPASVGPVGSGHILPSLEAYPGALFSGSGPSYLSGSGYGTPRGPNFALAQVGGFSAKASTTGTTTTFTVTNPASNSSFKGGSVFGWSVPDNPNGPNGPRHTINQTFTWSEENVCDR